MGRPTLGTEDVIGAMPREALTGYMRRHYGPERMVVAAAGALDHDRLLDLVQTHFADLPQVAPPPPEAARYGGGEFREDRDLDQVHIVLGFPSAAYGSPLHYPSMLLSTLLGGGMSSRCSRRSGSAAASSTPSTPSPTPSGTAASSPSTPAPARRKRRSWCPSHWKSCAACSATSRRKS
jgi:hypothetical protein